MSGLQSARNKLGRFLCSLLSCASFMPRSLTHSTPGVCSCCSFLRRSLFEWRGGFSGEGFSSCRDKACLSCFPFTLFLLLIPNVFFHPWDFCHRRSCAPQPSLHCSFPPSLHVRSLSALSSLVLVVEWFWVFFSIKDQPKHLQ